MAVCHVAAGVPGLVASKVTTVQYPAVDGDLGIHLGELQTSVEP